MKNRLYTFTALPIALLAIGSLRLKSDVEPLTPEFKTSTIEALAAAMKEEYVFPETATKVDADLKARMKAGEYDNVTDGKEFAKLLSQHMNALCKDAHLHVNFSKDDLPVRSNRDRPSKQEEEQFAKYVKLMNGGILSADRLVGNVGYIDTTGFLPLESARRSISNALEFLKDTDALIIDMRHNGGGSPETVQFFVSYFLDAKPVLINTIYLRQGNRTEEFWSLKKVPGSRYVGKDVFILTGKRTGSAAEEFSYDMKNLHRALLVGESTWGGANPGGVVRLNDHFSAFIPHGRAINPYTKTNWEGTGVEPDIKVPAADAFKTAHTLAIRRLMDKATGDDRARLEDALKAAEKGELK